MDRFINSADSDYVVRSRGDSDASSISPPETENEANFYNIEDLTTFSSRKVGDEKEIDSEISEKEIKEMSKTIYSNL